MSTIYRTPSDGMTFDDRAAAQNAGPALLDRLDRTLDPNLARVARGREIPADAPASILWVVDYREAGVPQGRNLPSVEDCVVLCDAPSPAQRLHHLARGAYDVLDARRPVGDLARTISRLAKLHAGNHKDVTLDDLYSRAPSMRALLRDARRTAEADTSLLLTGETGVGKEHLARAVHVSGPRKDKPFIVLNCCALPETLLESQLFGHERGAFTGADRVHKGFFEVANGGTLLLDEIGEMPAHLQVKLLTVLERRELLRLGSHTPIHVDVRVMAATNRDLTDEVKAGRFREDLYYRLNVIHLELPSLSQRSEDIPDLAGRFLHAHCKALGRGTFEGMDDAALQAIISYGWPGNVRELRNALERALVLNGGSRIGFDDLPQEIRSPNSKPAALEAAAPGLDVSQWDGRTLREVREAAVAAAERAYLERLLEQTNGRVGKTAARAGIRPRSLYDRMKQHGLRKEQFRNKQR